MYNKLHFDTLHSQNELLANHPNSRIYSTLSCLVEFDGYYLEVSLVSPVAVQMFRIQE
jgi:hypothetical protein